jgi:hypothetical protein
LQNEPNFGPVRHYVEIVRVNPPQIAKRTQIRSGTTLPKGSVQRGVLSASTRRRYGAQFTGSPPAVSPPHSRVPPIGINLAQFCGSLNRP